jgi:hypothetical protein
MPMSDDFIGSSKNDENNKMLPQPLSELSGHSFLTKNYDSNELNKTKGWLALLWGSIIRKLRLIILLVSAIFAIAFWISGITPAIYSSTVTIQLVPPFQNQPQLTADQALLVTNLSKEYFNTYSQTIKKDNLVKALVPALSRQEIDNLTSKNNVLEQLHHIFMMMSQRINKKLFSNNIQRCSAACGKMSLAITTQVMQVLYTNLR